LIFLLIRKKYSSPDGERTGMQQKLVKTVLEDKTVSDTEYSTLKFLHEHPTPMQPKLAKYDFDQTTLEFITRGAAKKADPELVCELSRLPDIKDDKEKYTEFFDNVIDISTDPRNKVGIEAMLNVGLNYGRRLDPSLQCLFWIWLDGKDIERFLRPFSKDTVAREGWQRTSTSRSYQSDKWKVFEVVTDRLSDGFHSSKYMQDNFSYSDEPLLENAEYMFNNKIGHCGGFARFDFLCLYKNGHNSKGYYLAYGGGVNHIVTTYDEDGKSFISSNGKRREYKDLESVFKQIAVEQGYTLKVWAESTKYFKGMNGIVNDEI
jgi:hypothetical protein